MSAKRYLAIETSSPRLSLAVGDETRVLGSYVGSQDWRHAENLFGGIEKLLRRVGWPVRTVSGVAVTVGPGSFTGIRIGLAVARALGQSLKIPVVGVSSLEVMAAGAKTRAAYLAPQIDALRGQIFTALFEKNGSGNLKRIVPEVMDYPAEWKRNIKKHTGSKEIWISGLQGCYPDARVLLTLARPRLAQAKADSYKFVLPLYIRHASAIERQR